LANVLTIFRRELAGYFATPIAYVFLIIFALLTGLFTFYVGNLYERGVADLLPFFNYLPWLLLVLVPAISMRLWSEERRAGTIELLMTLPVSTGAAVTGKWLAGVVFVAVALACTLPMWWTVNYLGQPDNGIIAVSYLGALVLAGVYLAIGGCMSALTSNQVIALCWLLPRVSCSSLQEHPSCWTDFARCCRRPLSRPSRHYLRSHTMRV
jgi:ABC-2 type transport system permease protein